MSIILCTSVVTFAQTAAAGRQGGALVFDVTDGRRVITRDMGGNLLLRVLKEKGISREHFGWRIEVVRKPYQPSSRNLLYHSRRTLGAHPSQVYAWHVAHGHFPNVRELEVRGRPLTVRVELLEPFAEGNGTDAGFVSGQTKLTWGRRQNGTRAARK